VWSDTAINPNNFALLKQYQKINHFPGMQHLSRKNYLAKNLKKMLNSYPSEYNFFPKTWLLPAETGELQK